MKLKSLVLGVLVGLFNFMGTCSAYNFENTGVSARVLGLSYTFAGIADDSTTLYWNPGGIAKVSGATFTFANPYNIPNYMVTNLSISKALDFGNGLGFSSGAGFLFSGDIGTVADESISTRFGESRLGLGLGFAKDKISFGGTGWISQLIDGDVKSREISMDFGFICQLEDLKVGVTVRNPRGSAPFETTMGVSYLAPIKKGSFIQSFILALDMTSCKYDGEADFSWNAGIEAVLSPGLAIRFGSNAINPISSLGLGFEKGLWLFDYAILLHELGNTHYFSIGYEL